MEDVKKTVEQKIVNGLMYVVSNPNDVLTVIGMAAWTMFVYRSGYRKGLASLMKKSKIFIICEKPSMGGK